jgi:HEAT repeat protein
MTEAVRPEVLISRLTSDNQLWRANAEARLVQMGEAAVDALIGALRHAHPSVRVHAVHALAKLRSIRALPPVIAALADLENNGAGAIAAEKALIDWGEDAKPALLQAAQSGADPIRARAVRALGKIGGADLKPSLVSLLGDSSVAVRTQAAVAIAAVSPTDALQLLAPLLKDSDKWVRYGVAEALARLGSVRARSTLEAARDDPEEQGSYIRFWAEELLDDLEELERTGRAVP